VKPATQEKTPRSLPAKKREKKRKTGGPTRGGIPGGEIVLKPGISGRTSRRTSSDYWDKKNVGVWGSPFGQKEKESWLLILGGETLFP